MRPEGSAGAATVDGDGLRLTGRHDRTVDAKGRLVLPSPHRAHFEAGGHLQLWGGNRLGLLTPTGFTHYIESVRRKLADTLAASGAPEVSVEQVMSAAYESAEQVHPDAQGRFIIPPRFRDLAPLGSPVVVTGALDRVDIWTPERYAAREPAAFNILEIMQDDYEADPR